MDKDIVTYSFSMNRQLYNNYKSIVSKNGENVKGNIIKYMQYVIDYGIPNMKTIEALEEVKMLKNNPHKKTYNSFAEMMKDLDDE